MTEKYKIPSKYFPKNFYDSTCHSYLKDPIYSLEIYCDEKYFYYNIWEN